MKSKMILLSSAITITMIITSLTVVSASQFNDVADNSAYAQAIEYCKKKWNNEWYFRYRIFT